MTVSHRIVKKLSSICLWPQPQSSDAYRESAPDGIQYVLYEMPERDIT